MLEIKSQHLTWVRPIHKPMGFQKMLWIILVPNQVKWILEHKLFLHTNRTTFMFYFVNPLGPGLNYNICKLIIFVIRFNCEGGEPENKYQLSI